MASAPVQTTLSIHMAKKGSSRRFGCDGAGLVHHLLRRLHEAQRAVMWGRGGHALLGAPRSVLWHRDGSWVIVFWLS